jgi:hypothetical protein
VKWIGEIAQSPGKTFGGRLKTVSWPNK